MISNDLHRRQQHGFARRLAFWIAVLLAVYVAYSATTFRGQPDAVVRFFAMLLERLPAMLAQILPPAVFAAALTRPVASVGLDTFANPSYWIRLGALSLMTYVLAAFVSPLVAQAFGSDGQFPLAALHAAESAREAAAQTTGREAASLLRRAAADYAVFFVAFSNAVFVVLAGVLGDLVGRLTVGLSDWPRYALRWLSGGILFAAFWISTDIAHELVAYYEVSPSLLLVVPLSVPLLLIAILIVAVRRGRA